MASYTKRTSTTQRYEYVMHQPVHVTEVGKALTSAQQDVDNYMNRASNGRSGVAPAIWVTSDDENVIVYWEHETSGPVVRNLNPSEHR